MSARAHDDKLNLRPMVLGACFVWGVTIGFIANAISSYTGDIRKAETANANAADSAGKKADTVETALQKDPDAIANVLTAPPKAESPTETAPVPAIPSDTPNLMERNPPLPEPALDTLGGLTGQTAQLPPMPLEVKHSPDLPTGLKNTAPKPHRPPELDLP